MQEIKQYKTIDKLQILLSKSALQDDSDPPLAMECIYLGPMIKGTSYRIKGEFGHGLGNTEVYLPQQRTTVKALMIYQSLRNI